MARYLVEIRHGDQHEACVKALYAITKYGSHFVTHAEFGCADGIHCGWLIADLDSRTEALQLVPPSLRPDARVVQLRKWSRDQIETLLKELND